MRFCSFDYFGANSAEVYFSPFAESPFALLLDSAGSSQANPNKLNDNSRYDIILISPVKVLISEDDKHWVKDFQSNETISVDDCFAQLTAWLDTYRTESDSTTEDDIKALPFTGGIAGAFAYDLGRQIENIPDKAKNELHVPDLVAGIYLSPLIIDHLNKTVTLYNYDNTETIANSLKQTITNSIQKRRQEESDSSVCHSKFKITQQWQSNLSEKHYYEKFNQVKNYIKSGDCYQINLAQRFSAPYEGSEWSAYVALRRLNSAPFSGFMNFKSGCLMSLSPERFIAIHQSDVITQPIKGTRPRSQDKTTDKQLQDELINSDKDRAENLMIVDLLRNDLGRTAVAGSVEVSELFGLYSFPSVHHLISTVTSKISDNTSHINVIQQAFPGGSITGAPKIRAMEIIEELEPHRRHFYCGSLAYFSFNGNSDSNILIRSLTTTNQNIYAWAGGGLVYDSESELEYQETFAKLSKILSPLSDL
jgi:para-aminobenzoate synthetase component 1